jgi:hypothetical protein
VTGLTITSMVLNGGSMSGDLISALTSADLERTIDGADTITLGLRDPHLNLLRSGIFASRATIQIPMPPNTGRPVNGLGFVLAAVKKNGRAITTVFEDMAAASLRRHDAPRKVAAGQMTRVDFARLLVSEERWIKFHAPVAGPRTKVELARGTFATKDARAEKESTWDALGRLADDVGWRRFTKDNAVWFLPETHLLAGAPAYSIAEDDPGIDSIDFDWDTGKPVSTVTVTARAETWAASPGTVIEIRNLPPVSGKWIVASVSESFFTTAVSIRLTKARPNLPEPTATPGEPSATLAGAGGAVGAVKPHVKAAAEEIGGKFGISTIHGIGERSGASDHPLGLALDFMVGTDKARGDNVTAYAIDNRARLRVKYVIWQQRIWQAGVWKGMADRGSKTANHYDHVHVSFH